jgi:dihydroneopterin aldolase
MANKTQKKSPHEHGDVIYNASFAQPPMRTVRQRILINDLTVVCRIGVTDKERAQHQRLRINLTLDVQPSLPRLDRIGEVVDYGALAARVREVCAEAEVRLLESLAGQLAGTCFEDSRVQRARVRIEKLDRYTDMFAIGCETTFERAGA